MRTHLRLHQELPAPRDMGGPPTYRFPAAMAAARRTLVAGVVKVPATPEPLARARAAPRSGVLAHIDRGVDCTTDSDRLLRDVEQTLDDMQTKLDGLREDAERAFKFPEPVDDGRPWAA